MNMRRYMLIRQKRKYKPLIPENLLYKNYSLLFRHRKNTKYFRIHKIFFKTVVILDYAFGLYSLLDTAHSSILLRVVDNVVAASRRRGYTKVLVGDALANVHKCF